MLRPNFSHKRKLYLLDFNSPSEINLPRLAKFVIQQIKQDFQQATYNDQVTGILYDFDGEAEVKSQLMSNQCYYELLVDIKAISEVRDGQVFIKDGFEPKILSVKTSEHVYHYDSDKNTLSMMPLHAFNSKEIIRTANRKIFNYYPNKWALRAIGMMQKNLVEQM